MLYNVFPSLDYGALPVVKNNRLYILNPKPKKEKPKKKRLRMSITTPVRRVFDGDGVFGWGH